MKPEIQADQKPAWAFTSPSAAPLSSPPGYRFSSQILVEILDWIIRLLNSGQLANDTPDSPFNAKHFRDTIRQSIKTGSLNLDECSLKNYCPSTDTIKKLAEIFNYCTQAFKHILLSDSNSSFTRISTLLSLLNLDQISVLESIHFSQEQQVWFISNPEIEIFYGKLVKNRTLTKLEWNVIPGPGAGAGAELEKNKLMLTHIQEHVDYNNACAVVIAAYVTLRELLPKVLVDSGIIEYLLGDKDYAPRLLKPVTLGDNCVAFLNINSKLSSPNNNQPDATGLKFAG